MFNFQARIFILVSKISIEADLFFFARHSREETKKVEYPKLQWDIYSIKEDLLYIYIYI